MRTTLIIEDDEGVLGVLKTMMEHVGAPAIFATNLAEVEAALEQLGQPEDTIQAVLLDGHLPDPQGAQLHEPEDVTRHLRRSGFTGNIIAIAGSEKRQRELLAADTLREASVSVPKPFSNLTSIIGALGLPQVE
ncbi:MAG: hypothetical protein OXT67_12295 [Zetaproteobacteria bacterium]|nr:hypothetical protein [Zetaproteobacteria bacterium]